MIIRAASHTDLPAISGILNHAIRTSTASLSNDEKSAAEMENWWKGRMEGAWPVLIAEGDEGAVLGYASFGPFRNGNGYRFTAEHSVYVKDGHQGAGIGAALMQQLITNARDMGLKVLIGGVTADNGPSIAFHCRLGFIEAARLNAVGHKFGRWQDLVFLQLLL